MKTKMEAMTHAELRALFDDMRWRLVFVTHNLRKRTMHKEIVNQLEVVKDCLHGLNCVAEGETV